MKLNLFKISGKSFLYNLRGTLYQIIIIIILAAVITGSLMTGKSVRVSLRKTSIEKLGNSDILISSGVRYFDTSLVERLTLKAGVQGVGILEIDGYCQSFTSGKSAPSIKIFAVNEDFFPFNGNNEVEINKGEVAINKKLADYLLIKTGDELIIHFNTISDLPADAPFSPGKESTASLVLKVGQILNNAQTGNFSLNISQIIPLNIFVNRSDLNDSEGKIPKINRLIINGKNNISVSTIYNHLSKALEPGDIGLKFRYIPETGGIELISSRVFIDLLQVDDLRKLPVNTYPVITYLANSITHGNNLTPYSFVSALSPELYPGVPYGNGILINKWLSDDLEAHVGDTLKMVWYSPDPMNHLIEESNDFVVRGIVDMSGIWADSLLMPDFPGIAGKESCTEWDAGVSIKMNLIRKKDEDYWKEYRGTPRAFISYETGKKIWGNNFGPATSIRFDHHISLGSLQSDFKGLLDPYKLGFIISDLPEEALKAADKSVDFSVLFLSLGFFIILSALILLVLAVSTFYDLKKKQVQTLYSLGFLNRQIDWILLFETGFITVAGSFLGAFMGEGLNILAIKALNSVWQGAVQTDTLIAGFDTFSLLIGFGISAFVILSVLKIKASGFLKKLSRPETGSVKRPSKKINILVLLIALTGSSVLVILSFVLPDYGTMLSFSAGITVFIFLIFLTRFYYIRDLRKDFNVFKKKNQISERYFLFNSSQAIAPILFLAAGLFAVIITGANRMSISRDTLKPSGGTGGYLLWGESSLPVGQNLNSKEGKKEYGLDEPDFRNISILQVKKTSGNDASCLNLNHIASPPLLGIDISDFIRKGSFSFAVRMKSLKEKNPWLVLDNPPENGTIYGIADQTVMQYGLKVKTGDTLKLRTEGGQLLNVIIAAGLKSSVFQGFVLIGSNNFNRFFPSVSGSQIFLVDGDPQMTESYKENLSDRLSEFGIHFETTAEKLSSFLIVTNTYLSVFTILGGIGLILGVAGLGFIVIRNFNQRKRDFGFMSAAGFPIKSIRGIVFGEQLIILLAGTLIGIISGLIATRPSLVHGSNIPWNSILLMIILILVSGIAALSISIRSIGTDTLISNLRKE